MQLKRLEAYGFKSFADKINLEFDNGITAIVGPNGSGKSNITDAVRWVLGEQNARSLRATKAEDIIFTGSATRHALGVAEVTLYFDNSDGTLPVDFREVAVTRRLYRSGDSEFYINKSKCRLKDIYNLFADTGIGHDGMSIIGQNRIDDILNAKPEERRAFFEETAGITKYRNRKRETLRRLEATDTNLVRVEDIIREIATQLTPLEKSAAKTREYNEINAEFQRYRLTHLAQKYSAASDKKADNDAYLADARDAVVAVNTEVQTVNAERETLSKEIIDLERAMQEQAERNEEVRSRLESASSEIATLREREEQSDAARERILRDRERLNHDVARALGDIAQLRVQMADQQKALETADSELDGNRTQAKNLAQKIRTAKDAVKAAETAQGEKLAELNQAEQALAVLEHDIESGSEGQAERDRAIDSAKARLAELEQSEQELAASIADSSATIATTEREVATQAEATAQAAAQVQTLQQQYTATEQELKSAQSKADFLTKMQQSYEGFGRAVKAVLKADKSREPWRAGISGAVAELVEVPREYVTAIEIALGGSLQNVVTEDTATAKAAIAYLKRERQGRVTFLPLSTIVERTPANIKFAPSDGVIGWASELVKADARYRKIVNHLLARTLIVDTLDNALALAKKQGYKQRIVTLEGELLAPGGSLSGGGRTSREASYMSRSGEIATLTAGIAASRERLAKLNAELKQAGEALATAREQESALNAKLTAARLELARQTASHASITENVTLQQRELAELQRACEEQTRAFAQLQTERVHATRAVRAAREELTQLASATEAAELDLDDLEQDAGDLASLIHDREVARAVLEQEGLQTQQHILLRTRDKEKSEVALRENEQEEHSLAASLAESKERLGEIERASRTDQAKFSAGREAHDKLYATRMERLAAREEAEQRAADLGRRVASLEGEVHRLELIDTKLTMTLEDLAGTILADFGLTPERALEEAVSADAETLGTDMAELEKRLKAIGPVNPNAIEEYEELKSRHDFMDKQMNDLVTAKADLEKVLAEMDKAMTKQFNEAFVKIQEYFNDIFVRLFGGGTAELRLLDPHDVLSTGVEIVVTLPQKKRQNLAALSGGERALTVIALLFAFLKYRPSPFSVLDEIDAPLDEANVTRFGAFLREFAASTQFIVVTHRKGTMEAVDTMYGVTIEDAGVSRILSVRLDDR